jgi:hypothetical protein
VTTIVEQHDDFSLKNGSGHSTSPIRQAKLIVGQANEQLSQLRPRVTERRNYDREPPYDAKATSHDGTPRSLASRRKNKRNSKAVRREAHAEFFAESTQ